MDVENREFHSSWILELYRDVRTFCHKYPEGQQLLGMKVRFLPMNFAAAVAVVDTPTLRYPTIIVGREMKCLYDRIEPTVSSIEVVSSNNNATNIKIMLLY